MWAKTAARRQRTLKYLPPHRPVRTSPAARPPRAVGTPKPVASKFGKSPPEPSAGWSRRDDSAAGGDEINASVRARHGPGAASGGPRTKPDTTVRRGADARARRSRHRRRARCIGAAPRRCLQPPEPVTGPCSVCALGFIKRSASQHNPRSARSETSLVDRI